MKKSLCVFLILAVAALVIFPALNIVLTNYGDMVIYENTVSGDSSYAENLNISYSYFDDMDLKWEMNIKPGKKLESESKREFLLFPQKEIMQSNDANYEADNTFISLAELYPRETSDPETAEVVAYINKQLSERSEDQITIEFNLSDFFDTMPVQANIYVSDLGIVLQSWENGEAAEEALVSLLKFPIVQDYPITFYPSKGYTAFSDPYNRPDFVAEALVADNNLFLLADYRVKEEVISSKLLCIPFTESSQGVLFDTQAAHEVLSTETPMWLSNDGKRIQYIEKEDGQWYLFVFDPASMQNVEKIPLEDRNYADTDVTFRQGFVIVDYYSQPIVIGETESGEFAQLSISGDVFHEYGVFRFDGERLYVIPLFTDEAGLLFTIEIYDKTGCIYSGEYYCNYYHETGLDMQYANIKMELDA